MKKSLLLTFTFLITFTFFSQEGIYNYGEEIMISKGTSIYVNGDVINNDKILSTSVTKANIFNVGEIYLTGNLINNYSRKLFKSDSLGKVIFNGNNSQNITGDSINIFYLIANNGSEIILNSDITINDTLLLQNGSLNLNNQVIYLPDNIGAGMLVGENENQLVYGSGGYIETTRTIGDLVGENVAGLGLIIQDSSTIGNSRLRRYHFPQTNAGDGSIKKFYTLQTNQPDSISVRINYFDNQLLGLNEPDLDIWLSHDSTIWRKQNSNNQFASNYVSDSLALTNINSTISTITLAERNCDTPPLVNIGNNNQYICGNDALILDAQNTGLEYKWNTGESSQNISVSIPGSYFVEVTDINGCVGHDTVSVSVKEKPVALFTTADNCLSETTYFVNSSSISSGNLSYFWNFGDLNLSNDTSIITTPNFTYQTAGLYTIQLTTTSDFGCDSTFMDTIRVHPKPQTNFSFSNACEDSLVQFTDATTITTPINGQNYAIANYNWTFGNDSTSTFTTPAAQQYNTAGTYSIKLITQSNGGCLDSLTQTITIHPNPTAVFTNTTSCENTAMSYINNSTGATSYNWDFGNGNNSNLISPSNLYTTAGNYNVFLTAISNQGCTNTTQNSVQVNAIPNASFSFTNACQNKSILFGNSSSSTSGTYTSSWNFNDGNLSSIDTPTNTFVTDGIYNVELVITGANTCTDTLSQNVTIYPKPNLVFSLNNSCAENVVNFTNNTSINGGSFTNNWNFGDNSNSTIYSPSHYYGTDGNYSIKLIATSDNNCIDSLQQSLTIYPLPSLNLGGTITTCTGSIVLDAQNPGMSYLWSDNSTNQNLTVNSDGTYWVSVTSNQGCNKIDTTHVYLNVPSIPILGNDTTVCDSLVLSGYSPSSSYTWSNNSTNSNLTALNSGLYWVERTDQNNCIGRDSIQVIVNTSPILNLGNDIVSCDNQLVQLDAQNNGNTILWSTLESTSQIIALSNGQYNVTVTNPQNCSTIDSINVTFNSSPTVFIGNDTTTCDSLQIDAGIHNSYLWSNNNTNQVETFTNTGNHWVTVTNAFNCSHSDTVFVTIFSSPNLELGNDTVLCFANTILLDAGISNSYSWNNGLTSQQVLADTSGKYSVTATSGICSVQDSITITIDTLWNINLGNNDFICPNETLTLDAGIPNWNYEWQSQNNGLLGNSQTVQVSESDMVWIKVTNPFGCSDFDTIIYNPAPFPVVSDFLVASEVYVGDTIYFVPVSTDSITSYSWNFDDGITSNDQFPNHIYYLEDKFYVQLIVANQYCSDTLIKAITTSLPLKSSDFLDFEIPKDTLSDIQYVWMYPNPNKGVFTLITELKKEKEGIITIYNLRGEKQHSHKFKGKELKVKYQLEDLSAGTYLIVVRVGAERKILKWVKL